MYGGNAGFWNRAGMMTGHMPAFMLDFGITGVDSKVSMFFPKPERKPPQRWLAKKR